MKSIKKFLLSLLTVIVFFIPLSGVSAHVLESSGSVGAVMHISPDDDPVAGSRSDFFFEFKDKKNKFDPKNCNCTVAIIENGKEIFNESLFSNSESPSLDNASFSFTFPQRDVYEVRVIGKPSVGNSFDSFTLTYNIRVERVSANLGNDGSAAQDSSSNWVTSHIPHIVGGVLSLVILALVIKKKSSQRS